MLYHLLTTALHSMLITLPGETFPPVLSQDIEEWQVECQIDYYLSDEDDESENSYFLLLKLLEENGQIIPTLSLQHFVQDVGANEIALFDIDTPETWAEQLANCVDEHDLHNTATKIGNTFLAAITPFIAAVKQHAA